MYYKRRIPIAGGIFRPLPIERYVAILGGGWPIMQELPDGRLGVITFSCGERSLLEFVTSPDGESQSSSTVISSEAVNAAFGVAPDGTLLVTFMRQPYYSDEIHGPPEESGHPLYICRSYDGGATWSEEELAVREGEGEWNVGSPFGKMLTLPDGTIIMHFHSAGATFLIRSRDNGASWTDQSTIARGEYNETALCHLGDGRFIGMMRLKPDGPFQTNSDDWGYTWSEPRRVTGLMELPGDLIRLRDGRLLLTYGERVPPFGVQGMISRDEGETWDGEQRLMLAADNADGGGYPCSVQLEDGTIVTVCYARGLTSEAGLTIHSSALLYRPKDLP
jgi:hypothetical protein